MSISGHIFCSFHFIKNMDKKELSEAETRKKFIDGKLVPQDPND